ncbi:hypothetical protein LTR92_008123 [Exophiala xenobiotica]|nr:hypothetical protein LTR92_008123 [Exophiala xenobiotica]KAK5281186.1 hypothetical protein LTR40_005249 [Exophiala xenobiotica]KAK5482292.1 hypothetical protein LTR26_006626 [Exophiala xenobiotica]KAK5549156.1 hypothetical protein LTR23_000986 [Chaetothyriales sp. CCFEE 6169]
MADLEERVAFCTFGMFIIDQIEYLNGRVPAEKILGGAGTYAALGARLAAGEANSKYVSWIVDMGSDFPPEFKVLIDAWQTRCTFRLDMSRLSTTAWNGYGPNEYRAFKYLTPKLRLDENSLSDEQALARSFHMVCSPARCISIIEGIMARRRRLAEDEPRPIFVWEPVPEQCTPAELERVIETAAHVDVVSPNAEEFAALFTGSSEQFSRLAMVEKLLGQRGLKPLSTALVVREGAQGCTMYRGSRSLHLPAYHQSAERVIDPTGGGNTFLGALAIAMTGTVSPSGTDVVERQVPDGFTQQKPLLFALVHATVAASYAIEQVGMPVLATSGTDAWNGEPYQERFMSYLHREGAYISEQLEARQSSNP